MCSKWLQDKVTIKSYSLTTSWNWEALILFGHWAGHRLLSEKVSRPHVRAHRPISISSVPISEGIDNWQENRFISSPVRALGKLRGGPGRFAMHGWSASVQFGAFWGGSSVHTVQRQGW